MAQTTDAELLGSGDPQDFGRFYERHVGVVVSFISSRVRRADVVFDLAAETFARALERRGQYDPGRGLGVAWVLGIAQHLVIDAARRGQVASDARSRLSMAPVTLTDEQLARVEERGRVDLRAALGGISDEQRVAIVRRVVLEQSYGDIARDLRCSEQVVRQRVSRGLATMRGTLEGPT
jgi:RNA polymerase sigma-70 factor (ECF subfamily)